MMNTLNLNKRKTLISCRICLSDEHNNYDPLIRPCKCDGTMKYVHFHCIKHWLKSHIDTKSTYNITVYKIKKFECELCKFEFPEKVKINNEIFNLIDIDSPINSNFIILENVKNESTEKKCYYVIDFKNQTVLSLGRTNDCDVTLCDSSISKRHSKLKIIDNSMYIEDCSSKFGTLVHLKSPLHLIFNRKITVQFNNFNISFKSIPTFSASISCICFKDQYKNYSDLFNDVETDKEFIVTCDLNDLSLAKESHDEIKVNENYIQIDYKDESKGEKKVDPKNYENNSLLSLKIKGNTNDIKKIKLVKLNSVNTMKSNNLKIYCNSVLFKELPENELLGSSKRKLYSELEKSLNSENIKNL